ncbi:MAG TPA: DinB family protein [Acidobacteriaceae bacterium]|nr:DinB family protein [Acidobacteriaceae bacterium]
MTEQNEAKSRPEAYPNPEEKQALLDLLTTSGSELFAAVELHTHHQPRPAKPEGTWSPAQIVEHVILTDTAMIGAVKKALSQPVREDWKTASAGKADTLQNIALGVNKRVASETLTPSENIDLCEVMERFQKHRRELLDFFETQLSEPRLSPMHAHLFTHARLGDLSAYQWGLTIGYHTLRHVRQVRGLLD